MFEIGSPFRGGSWRTISHDTPFRFRITHYLSISLPPSDRLSFRLRSTKLTIAVRPDDIIITNSSIMPPSVDSVEFATVIHKPTPSRTTSSATFQTAPSDIESFHSLDYDDDSAGSKSLILPDDGGSITPTQESRLPARSRSLDTLYVLVWCLV
jgi:hypothetical protein